MVEQEDSQMPSYIKIIFYCFFYLIKITCENCVLWKTTKHQNKVREPIEYLLSFVAWFSLCVRNSFTKSGDLAKNILQNNNNKKLDQSNVTWLKSNLKSSSPLLPLDPEVHRDHFHPTKTFWFDVKRKPGQRFMYTQNESHIKFRLLTIYLTCSTLKSNIDCTSQNIWLLPSQIDLLIPTTTKGKKTRNT